MSIRTYPQPVTPTPATVDLAQKAVQELDKPGAGFVLVDRATGNEVPLGDQMLDLIRQMLTTLARNRAITIVPLDHELTPNQAAELLHVSRGFVNGLIDRKELPAHMVGTHRRIRLEDLLAYKVKADAAHDAGMRDLAALEQELGLE